MIHRKLNSAPAIASVGLAALICLTAASSAIAQPSLGIELERDSAEFPTVSHSDERVDYTVRVKNAAPALSGAPNAGDRLFCDGAGALLGTKGWQGNLIGEEASKFGTVNYSYEFRWVANGVPVTAWSADPGARAYTVAVADQGKALQCLVKGTNGAKSGSFVAASQPPLVANPQPATAPPAPGDPNDNSRRPIIAGNATVAGDEITCTVPGGWSGSPAWSFEWLRNGVSATAGEVTETTATTSKFKIAAPELEKKAEFQCLAVASNAGGATAVESLAVLTKSPAPEFGPNVGANVSEDGAAESLASTPPTAEHGDNTIFEPVQVEVELPGGAGTRAYKVVNILEGPLKEWSCDTVPPSGTQNAKAICSTSVLKRPQEAYEPFKVITAIGADAPDLAVALATAFGGSAPAPASAEDQFVFSPALGFGLTGFEAGLFDCAKAPFSQAGGHPCYGAATFNLATKRKLLPESTGTFGKLDPVNHVKSVITDLPRGQVGNALATPEMCSSVTAVIEHECPKDSLVGGVALTFNSTAFASALYAIEPEYGSPAQFAFLIPGHGSVVTLTARVRPEDGYAVSLDTTSPVVDLLEATATVCDYGAKRNAEDHFTTCKEPGEAGANSKPLFSNPTRCGNPPPTVHVRLTSWEESGAAPKDYEATTPPITGCDQVPFEPTSQIAPESKRADSPTGLDVSLSVPTNGLEGKDDEGNPDPEAIMQSNLKAVKIAFPEGMAVNASAGAGLGSCSLEQIGMSEVGGELIPDNEPVSCPDSSKVGTIEVETPILESTLKGPVYVARQGDVEGALLGLYLVLESKKDGLIVKVPSKVVLDPVSGRLTAIVPENPEAPFSEAQVHFAGGPRATLITPPKCGHYEIKAELTPYSGTAPVTQASGFDVTEGPSGGPCPSGALAPSLEAGSSNPLAGQVSPFNLRLHREDGSDRFNALSLTMPPGLTAYLTGIPYCPDATLASIPSKEGTGQAEIDHPSCPAASKLGSVIVGAGAGPSPLYVDTAKAYLAGPYKGAPLSIAVVAPAVAGPLDLGNVVIRNALYLNPRSAEVKVVSDPIPTILHGLLLDVRDVRVSIDRPRFTLNPTGCEAKSIGATVGGEGGASATLSNHFQVGGCEALGFKPALKTTLIGGTKRGAFPAFRAAYAPRPGDANLESLALRFPRSEFIEQGHFRTICTRVQYAAGQCPAGSVYGHITAVTPLLDQPLEGPVYLRSSDHNLPDVVFALHGQVDAEAAVRIDSKQGGLRASIEGAPDVPLTKVVLEMQGGAKGLFVNSRDICAATFRSSVKAAAHNGREYAFRPPLANGRCGKARNRARHRGAG